MKLTVYIVRVTAVNHDSSLLQEGQRFGESAETTRSVDRGTLQAVSPGGGRVSVGVSWEDRTWSQRVRFPTSYMLL